MQRVIYACAGVVATCVFAAACGDEKTCAAPAGIWRYRIVTSAGDCGIPRDAERLVDLSDPSVQGADDPLCTGGTSRSANMCVEETNERCPQRDPQGNVIGWVRTVGVLSQISPTRWEGTAQFSREDASGNLEESCIGELTLTKL